MKKILFVIAFAVTIISCKNKFNKVNDMSKYMALLKSKEIPKAQAEAMIKHFHDPGGKTAINYKFDWTIFEAAVTYNGDRDVYIMPIRFSKTDEADYCKLIDNPQPNDERCKVDGYNSFIIQSGSHTTYYLFCTICPPPDPCP